MDYEKAYKEALERASKLRVQNSFDTVSQMMEYVFPELGKLEDERIKKAIIKILKGEDTYTSNENTEEYVAWLEKQDKETSWKPSKEEMDVLYGLAYITNQYDEYKEEVITRLYQDLKREFFNGSSYENMFPTNTSAEDDVRCRSTIQVLEYARSLDTYNQYGKADIDKNIAWLEKQKDTNVLIQEASEKAYTEGMRVERKHWLEKQGESTLIEEIKRRKELYSREKEKAVLFAEKLSLGGRIAVLEELLVFANEKQGEQKPILDFKASNWYVSKVDGKIHDLTYNPTDKTEPTFKVGDWIVTDKNNITQIKAVNNGYYTIDNGMDFNMSYVDKYWRLWTIQDAEDGDVIYNTKCNNILIYKHQNGTKDFVSSCRLSLNTGTFYSCKEFEWGDLIWQPATKEQHDILFQKMKETGYEWDDESKELKKIDQKPTYMIKPKFKVGDWIVKNDTTNKPVQIVSYEERTDTTLVWFSNGTGTDIDFLCGYHLWTIQDSEDGDVLYSPTHHLVWIYKDDKHYYVCVNLNYTSNNVSVDGSISVPNDVCPATTDERTILFAKMKEAGYEWDTEEKELRKIEQKPAWSDEDEKIYQSIMDDTVQENQLNSKQINWLRDIKYRYFPQSKQKWSEEDEKMLHTIIADFKGFKHDNTSTLESHFNECIDWLKFLKDRVQPQNLTVTDEELAQAKKNAYNDALDKIEYRSGEPTFDDGWSAAIWYLKKRNTMPKSQWKPSEEQMHDLRLAIDSFTFEPDYLQELYEDLKKLAE